MIDYLELLKVEQALRSEKMKLEYRKNNKPSEISILDYTVIAALEKQIPQKPHNPIGMDGNPNALVKYCYTCGNHLKDQKFCKTCGQKIDWD